MSRPENMISSGASSPSTTSTGNKQVEQNLWEDIFPFEIIMCHSLIMNETLVKILHAMYVLAALASVGYVLFMFSMKNYVHEATSVVVLGLIQGAAFLFIPYICNWFYKHVISSSDMNNLIEYALKVDNRVQLKFAVVTHFNFLFVIVAGGLFLSQDRENTIGVILICVFYMVPLTAVASLGVCVIELHRILIQQFRQEINAKRSQTDMKFWNQSIDFVSDITRDSNHANQSMEMTSRPSNTNRDSGSNTASIDLAVTEFRDKYYHIYALCRRSSLSIGLYLLFFICFGFLYAFSTIYSVYLGEYQTKTYIGFALEGFVVSLGLGAALTAANETGHLVCRDLSSYLVSLPSHGGSVGRVSSVATHHTQSSDHGPDGDNISSSDCSSGQESLKLLSAMTFMKLQICYFGDMALRSSLSFALLGSLLLAVIPVLIKEEG